MSGIHVNEGGAWKLAKALFVKDGGAWKRVKAAFVKDGGAWVRLGADEPHSQRFNAPGTYTYVVPFGLDKLDIELVGGGGAGRVGSGSGGGYSKLTVSVGAGDVVGVVVGAGGYFNRTPPYDLEHKGGDSSATVNGLVVLTAGGGSFRGAGGFGNVRSGGTGTDQRGGTSGFGAIGGRIGQNGSAPGGGAGQEYYTGGRGGDGMASIRAYY